VQDRSVILVLPRLTYSYSFYIKAIKYWSKRYNSLKQNW